MPQLAPPLIKARAAQLRARGAEVRTAWLRSLIGQPLSVLAEQGGTGHAENFAPVALPAGTQPGTLTTITPTAIEQGMLR